MASKNNFGRRTWDREEYLQLEKTNKGLSSHDTLLKNLKDTDQVRYQQLYQKYASNNYDALLKSQLKDTNKLILKSTLENSSTTGKRGKKIGFYCDLCDLTFNNNMEFVDHLNDKQHFSSFEKIFNEDIVLNKRDNDDIPISEFKTKLNELVKQYKHLPKKDQPNHTPKNNEKVKKPKKKAKKTINKGSNDMAKTMGFSSFK